MSGEIQFAIALFAVFIFSTLQRRITTNVFELLSTVIGFGLMAIIYDFQNASLFFFFALAMFACHKYLNDTLWFYCSWIATFGWLIAANLTKMLSEEPYWRMTITGCIMLITIKITSLARSPQHIRKNCTLNLFNNLL